MDPPHYEPMLATPGQPPTGAGWGHEVKWDGVRCIATASGDGTWNAVTRTGRSLAARFPELADLAAHPRPCVLDGEIVCLDDDGRPDFGLLQTRLQRTRPQAGDAQAVLMAFDLLWDGRPTIGVSYKQRRAMLDELHLASRHIAVPPHWTGDREAALKFTRERGLEGIVSKRLMSPYQPGVRSKDWIKHKLIQTLDALVIGWQPDPTGHVARSLLLAVAVCGLLTYAGRVGSGISDREARQLADLLTPLAADRPAVAVPDAAGHNAHWVTPRVVVEVSHLERTRAGHLRHPVFERIRQASGDEPEY